MMHSEHRLTLVFEYCDQVFINFSRHLPISFYQFLRFIVSNIVIALFNTLSKILKRTAERYSEFCFAGVVQTIFCP